MTQDNREYGGWIQTYTGRAFNALNPDPKTVDIFDIAHGLALACRWTGHVRFHYSVGQHSVLVSQIVPPRDALWGLLHDASEAYLTDMARPIKVKMPQYYDIEKKLMAAVCEHFCLPREMPDTVRWADDVLLCSEARDLLPPCERPWSVASQMPTERVARIRPWPIWYTEYRFLKQYARLEGMRFWPIFKQFAKNKLRDMASLVLPQRHDPAAVTA